MNNFKTWLMEEESGQGLVEYALIIALVAIAVVIALTAMGDKVREKFADITTKLG